MASGTYTAPGPYTASGTYTAPGTYTASGTYTRPLAPTRRPLNVMCVCLL